MINKWCVLIVASLFAIGCGAKNKADVVAEAGDRHLTRADFLKMTGLNFDSVSHDERWPVLSGWVELAMLEQEIASSHLREEPALLQKEKEIVAHYYRAVLLSRQPVPVITDSLVLAYYTARQNEFKRSTDSYVVESFWCESDDSLKNFRRALEKADTANLKSGFVIWEGKWLAESDELDPPILSAIRSIQPGNLTQVLPFGEGYRLVRLHEVYPEGAQLGIDAVRGEIRERLLTEQSQRRQERWESDLRNRYQPKIMGESK